MITNSDVKKKFRELCIDIHNSDGGYSGTDSWFYDWVEYQNIQALSVSRKYVNEQLEHKINAGSIIGNIYWMKKPQWLKEETA
jgi:hypothetical protein